MPSIASIAFITPFSSIRRPAYATTNASGDILSSEFQFLFDADEQYAAASIELGITEWGENPKLFIHCKLRFETAHATGLLLEMIFVDSPSYNRMR